MTSWPGDDAPAWAWWLPAVATMAVIGWLSHQPDLPSSGGLPDWSLHGVAYAFLGATCVLGATRGFRARRWSAYALVTAFLVTVAYGAIDEVHQGFVGRDMSLLDWVADVVGAAAASVAAGLLGPRRSS